MKKSKRTAKASKKAGKSSSGTTPGDPAYGLLTVALIREPEGADTVEVAFSESARFYRLLRTNPGFETTLAALRQAKEQKRPVLVAIESPLSNVIADAKTT